MDEDGGAMNQAVQHGKSIARSHRHMKVDLARLIDKLHREGGSEPLDFDDEVCAIILAEARHGEHANNITPDGGSQDDVSVLANLTGWYMAW